jgi:peptide/nickel transport system permease protein
MSRHLAFVLRRLLLTVPTLFVMSVVVFLILRLVPGERAGL